MSKIAVYGGSFNPIHIGHLWVAQQLIETYPFDEIWFLASKNGFECDKTLLPIKTRMLMLTAAIHEFDNPKFTELQAPEIYTFENMFALQEKYPNNEFTIILGNDRNIKKFKDYDKYGCEFNHISISRPTFEDPGAYDLYQFNIEMNVSSTIIRDRLSKKKTINGLVPKSVKDYISENRLYDYLS